MGAMYVDSYDPLHHKYNALMRDAQPNASTPLVVAVDEGDLKMLEALDPTRSQTTRSQRGDQMSVKMGDWYDKGSVNGYFDRINGDSPNVVLVVTGNTPFMKLQAQLDDLSITKASRLTVVNVGGGPEYDRDGLHHPVAPATPSAESDFEEE
ncbi:MAG: hypothetical protein B7Z66_15110 [Chromatiales bacterium 21-64-14]|nr:MAG: hypothetical protein B7Z66_15110 [Chromatiales bacterium 21-64-14]